MIIISLTRQLSEATDDFGRTIESPANQMRILNEQWERLSRAIGNLFLPILSKVLPYLNAVLMVLTEIINVLASFLGYQEEDYDYFGGVADSVIELEEGLGGATESAKKLKQGLRGFDKLNVITTPSAGASGGGVGSGISPQILDEFNKTFDDYNKRLSEVHMKATRIRDRIMEWLGFTKQVDAETGKVSFKFDHITGGTILGALAVGGVIFNGVKILFNILKKVLGLNTFTRVAKLDKKLVTTGGTIAKLATKTTTLKAAFVALASKIGVSVGALAGISAAVAAAVAALGVLVYKGLQPASKQINIFKNISKETKESISPFIEKTNELSKSLNKLEIANVVSENDIKEVKTNLSKVTKFLKDDYEKDIKLVEEQISNAKLFPSLTEQQRNEIINNAKKTNNDRINLINEAEDRINEILQTASTERRSLKQEEIDEINALENKLQEEGIKTLTESEEEQRLILTRMKNNSIALKVEEYSEILKAANKNKEDMIRVAEQKRDEQIKTANTLRYDLKSIDDQTYQTMLDDAEKNYKEAVKKADDSYQEIADKAEEKLGKAANNLDLETGKILNNFQKWGNSIKSWWDNLHFHKKTVNIEYKDNSSEIYSRGTYQQQQQRRQDLVNNRGRRASGGVFVNGSWQPVGTYALGGLPPVGQMFVAREKGPELVGNLGGHTAVMNNNQIVASVSSGVAKAVSSVMGGNKQPVVQNFYLDAEHKIGSYVIDDFKDISRRNGKPIVIG